MPDIKERLSLLWLFALLNYLYADVLALFAFVGSPNSAPHLPQWALLGSAVLMEIPIAMILACRLLPFRANRLANIIAGGVMTLTNAFLTFVLPLTNGAFRDPVYPAYVFFATIETVCTSVIIWQAWTWSGGRSRKVSSEWTCKVRVGITSGCVTRPKWSTSSYRSFAYSTLACFKMGTSRSASFQRAKKPWYAAFALAVSPAIA